MADWREEDGEDWDNEVQEGSIAEDDKLKEYWAKKDRRRSSFLKDFVGDGLCLRENQRIAMYLAKFGESSIYGLDLTFHKFTSAGTRVMTIQILTRTKCYSSPVTLC